MAVYNPASLRMKTFAGTVEVPGTVELLVPEGSIVNLGRGIVRLDLTAAISVLLDRKTLSGTQNGVNAVFTIPGTATWSVVWVLRNGQLIDTTTYTVGGTGNRTVTMTMSNLPNDPGGDPELLEVIGVHT